MKQEESTQFCNEQNDVYQIKNENFVDFCTKKSELFQNQTMCDFDILLEDKTSQEHRGVTSLDEILDYQLFHPID